MLSIKPQTWVIKLLNFVLYFLVINFKISAQMWVGQNFFSLRVNSYLSSPLQVETRLLGDFLPFLDQ